MNGKRSVEHELLKLLRHGGLQKDNLAALVKIVAGFSDSGLLKNLKVFPRGIPPVYESLEVSSIVSAGNVASGLEKLVTETAIGHIRLFPYGVPVPDWVLVTAVVGPSPVEGGSVQAQAAGE